MSLLPSRKEVSRDAWPEQQDIVELDYTPAIIEKGAVDAAHFELIGGNTSGSSRDAIFPYQWGDMTYDKAARLYMVSPIINSTIEVGAGMCTQAPFQIMRSESKKNRNQRKQVLKGYPWQMFDWVNPHMSFGELIRNTYSWYKLVGEAYWAIEWNEPQYEDISLLSIYPLNPKYVKVVPDPDTGTRGYIYRTIKDIYFTDKNVLHFKNFNPNDYWLGNNPLNSLITDIEVERFLKRTQRNIFGSSIYLDGILSTTDDIGLDEIARVKREFREQYNAGRNSSRVAILDQNMKYEQLKAPDPGAGLAALIHNNYETHSIVMGIPVPLLTGEPLSRSTKLIDVEGMAWKQTVKPFLDYVAEVITKRCCRNIDPLLNAEFNYLNVDALRTFELDRVKMETAAIASGRTVVNEVRSTRNDDPIILSPAVKAVLGPALSEFADIPLPVFNALVAIVTGQQSNMGASNGGAGGGGEASPSLSLPGSEGSGRDQSNGGETQMVDTTGTRSASDDIVAFDPTRNGAINKQLLEFIGIDK